MRQVSAQRLYNLSQKYTSCPRWPDRAVRGWLAACVRRSQQGHIFHALVIEIYFYIPETSNIKGSCSQRDLDSIFYLYSVAEIQNLDLAIAVADWILLC